MLHSDERPLREEFADLIVELRHFLRLEIELARTELSPKLVRFGWHVVVMMAGCIIASLGFLAILTSAIMGLAEFVPPWLAALMAGILLAGCGAFLMVRGKKGIFSEPIMPEKTVESLKEAAQRVKDELV